MPGTIGYHGYRHATCISVNHVVTHGIPSDDKLLAAGDILNIDVTARVRHKFFYGTFDITGPDIEKGKGNVNAFVNTLTDKMRSLTEMMLKDLNMQTYLDGTGVRATVTAALSGANIPVDQVKYLRVGMQIRVG